MIRDDGSGVTKEVLTKDVAAATLSWSLLSIQLGGMAGEAAVLGRSRSGPATNDLEEAVVMAEQIIRGHAQDSLPWEKEGGGALPFRLMFKTPKSVEIITVLETGYRHARYLLAQRRPAFQRLAAVLIRRRQLDETALTALLGPRFHF